MRPKLAITLGDPAGIGPEIVAAELARASAVADVAIIGHWPSLARAIRDAGGALPLRAGGDAWRLEAGMGPLAVHTGTGDEPLDAPCPATCEAQLRGLAAAVDAALDGRCDAIVTGPISKADVASISPGFIGHTEYLATRCGLGPDDVTMVFASDSLAVGLITTHAPVAELPSTITRTRYERTLAHVLEVAAATGTAGRRPRIAVAGFNPHAGEGGLLGREEREIIEPFCAEARAAGADVVGPVPADTVFRDAFAGAYDGVVAAYHDQAMIPLKLRGFGRTVNVTAGLPFVRTSPDHGVARDIARRGTADPSGMRRAIEVAIALSRARQEEGDPMTTLWTPGELAVLERLRSPADIQAFLDGLTYSADPFYRSPRRVLADRLAHCFDGAVFAACALERLGSPPLLIDLRAVHDDDHVVAVFERRGLLGAIAKSNFAGLRYREPIHRTPRELALSFFDAYYNVDRERTLRSFCAPLDIREISTGDWRVDAASLEGIAEALDAAPHERLFPEDLDGSLLLVDDRSYRAGLEGAVAAGLYRPQGNH